MTIEEETEGFWTNLADLIVAVRDKTRAQALEEAARVAEVKANGYLPTTKEACSYNIAHNIAAAIRALNDHSPQQDSS